MMIMLQLKKNHEEKISMKLKTVMHKQKNKKKKKNKKKDEIIIIVIIEQKCWYLLTIQVYYRALEYSTPFQRTSLICVRILVLPHCQV